MNDELKSILYKINGYLTKAKEQEIEDEEGVHVRFIISELKVIADYIKSKKK